MAGKLRSPNYPALGLDKTVEAARKLWAQEKRSSVPHAIAAKAFGFGSLSGPARVMIGALRQYGLLDKPDAGHVRLSQRAVDIIHGNDADMSAALTAAASTPRLFRELVATYPDASDDTLRSYLLTKKDFSEDGAIRAIKAYRSTLKLAKPEASGYTPEEDAGSDDEMDTSEPTQPDKKASMTLPTQGKAQPADGMFSMNVPFSKGTISVQVRVTGDAISPTHLARVRRYQELAESDWDGDEQ